MAYFLETVTHSTTGVKTRTIGFQPQALRITIGKKVGVTVNSIQQSVGVSDGTLQYVDSIYGDTAALATKRDTAKLVSQWEKVAGTWTEVVAATFDSFTATEVKYNVTTGNVNYQFQIEVWG